MSAKRKYPWGFSYARYPQPTIEELQKQAEQTLRQAGEKSRQYEPVHVSGTQLCRHWWGKAWCKAIESYSDMSNRLARGRRYLKADTVLDLRLEPGEIHALVQGSRVKPYKVHITVDPLSAQFRKKIEEACAGSLHDMEALRMTEMLVDDDAVCRCDCYFVSHAITRLLKFVEMLLHFLKDAVIRRLCDDL